MTTPATSSSAAPPTSRRRTATAPSAPSSPPTIPDRRSLRRGEAYKGPATLFGKTFMTAYYPIVNPAGKVIGLLYVGIPMAQFETMLSHAIQNMAIAAGIAALLVMMLTMLIVRRVTKPLTSVTASLTAIANGNADVEIDCDERMDEIGEIARTLAVFKNNSVERQPDARRTDRGCRCRRRAAQG